jgi:hypothetical protein
VADYLNAITTAQARPAPTTSYRASVADARWTRAQGYLAPATARGLLQVVSHVGLRTSWPELGRDVALVGFELLAVRRAPLGGAVVVARERTAERASALAVSAACVYLLGPLEGIWRIVDKRCGRDFGNGEILSSYAGAWDAPGPGAPAPEAWFGDGLE